MVEIPINMTPVQDLHSVKPSTTRVVNGKVQTVMPWELDKYETLEDKQIRLNYEINKKKDIEAATQQIVPIQKVKFRENLDEKQLSNIDSVRVNFIKNNLNDMDSLINLSSYPIEFGTMLYNEGFVDNLIRNRTAIDFNKNYRARNGDKGIFGNFGLDSVTSEEIDQSNLSVAEKENLKSRLVLDHPFDGDKHIGIDSLTLNQAAALFDVKMKNAENILYNKFGKENVDFFFNINSEIKPDIMRVLYRKPNKIKEAEGSIKRNIKSEPLTIEEFYDFLLNYGGKNSSLSQSESFRTLLNK